MASAQMASGEVASNRSRIRSVFRNIGRFLTDDPRPTGFRVVNAQDISEETVDQLLDQVEAIYEQTNGSLPPAEMVLRSTGLRAAGARQTLAAEVRDTAQPHIAVDSATTEGPALDLRSLFALVSRYMRTHRNATVGDTLLAVLEAEEQPPVQVGDRAEARTSGIPTPPPLPPSNGRGWIVQDEPSRHVEERSNSHIDRTPQKTDAMTTTPGGNADAQRQRLEKVAWLEQQYQELQIRHQPMVEERNTQVHHPNMGDPRPGGRDQSPRLPPLTSQRLAEALYYRDRTRDELSAAPRSDPP